MRNPLLDWWPGFVQVSCRLGSTCGARPGSLDAASSMPGRLKRSKVERTLTFGSVPRAPLATG